jgi:NAD(P)-dependent dehydrogenase (short-subunit alcohol dehydrogenase family)
MRQASLLLLLALSNSWSCSWAWTTPLNRRQVLVGAAAVSAAGLVFTGGVAQASDLFTLAPGSLKDQIIVVTGGTTGLGLESVERLAVSGATIIFTARTTTKGEAALEKVRDYLSQRGVNNPNVSFKVLDLDNLQMVKAIPDTWKDVDRIDVLMNNAGVMAIPDRQLTVDGYERTMQSNHLGHFALTSLLASKFSSQARIINVSSLAYMIAANKGLLADDALWKTDPQDYGPWSAYGQSKLANILFTQELQRRSQAAGLGWTVVCLHPGAVNTDLPRYMMGEEQFSKSRQAKEQGSTGFMESIVSKIVSSFLKDIPDGATTQVWLAARADQETKQDVRGQFLDNCKVQSLSAFAMDPVAAERLWKESEERAGVKFNM